MFFQGAGLQLFIYFAQCNQLFIFLIFTHLNSSGMEIYLDVISMLSISYYVWGLHTTPHSQAVSCLCYFICNAESFQSDAILVFSCCSFLMFNAMSQKSLPIAVFLLCFLLVVFQYQMFSLCLYSILHWFLYMVWDSSFIEFPACEYLAFQATLIEEMDFDIVCLAPLIKLID